MLIAIEGIDGAGKRTQAKLLEDRAQALGIRTAVLSFPRYGHTFFAKSIEAYLNGMLGDLDSVHPWFAALLFAGDRFESLGLLSDLSGKLDLVILDRYVASNMAHQAARIQEEKARRDCISWIAQLEYEVFNLPRADLTVYLDVPVEFARRRIQGRLQEQSDRNVDIHEREPGYLSACLAVYRSLAAEDLCSEWIPIAYADPDGRPRGAAEIHESIWSAVGHRIQAHHLVGEMG